MSKFIKLWTVLLCLVVAVGVCVACSHGTSDVEAPTNTQAITKNETEAPTQVETETGPEVETEVETETITHAETEAETEVETVGRSLEFELAPDGQSYICVGIGSYPSDDVVVPATHKNLPVTLDRKGS